MMLGRHVEHDERSRSYPAERTAQPLQSVHWQRRSPILDQGSVGACTGFTAADWLATDTKTRQGRADIVDSIGRALYSKATHLDRIKGAYPPSDTGSSGLAAAKAMRALGYTTGPYKHCFGLQHLLEALQTGPVMLGIAWKTGCDTPDAHGVIRWAGTVRGGHEILVSALDVTRGLVEITNHWGASWGLAGRAWLPTDDLDQALQDHGDATVPS